MANPFRHMRALSDQQLGDALLNHKATLQQLIRHVVQLQSAQRITSWWLVSLTIAVIVLFALAVMR